MSLDDFEEFCEPFFITFEDEDGKKHKIPAFDEEAMNKAIGNPNWHVCFG